MADIKQIKVGTTTYNIEPYTKYLPLSKVAKLGSTTKPVYISADGTFAAASTYAGGTKVTLNGTDKGASTASLYAPTAVGTDGQILKSNGTGAPTWVAQNDLRVGYASSAGSATAATTATYATNDQLGNNIKDTYATKAELAKLPTTDTWRVISVNGKTIFGGATNTAGLNLQAGSNVTIDATPGSPNVTIDVKDTVALKTDLADYLPLTGGTIDGNLTLTDNSDNSGIFTAPCIELGYTDDIYGRWYYDEGIYVGGGDAAHLHPLGLTLNYDNSSIELNGSNSNIFIPNICGLVNNATRNAFGFSDEGEPVIVNTSGYNGFLLGGALDNGAFYEFPEKPDDAGSMYVLCTSSQGTSGQVLTSNGNGAPTWVAQSVIDLGTITEDPASTTNSVLNAITDSGVYVFKWYDSEICTTDCYIMTVNTEEYDDGTKDVYQHVSNMSFSAIYYRFGYTGNSEWSCNLKYPQSMGSTTCSSNYANKKLYLVGATSQTYEANTYSNKNIYIDAKNSLCSLSGGITVNKIWARTNNPDDYGYVAGSTGQVLKTNGTYVYWDENTTEFTGNHIYLNSDDSELIVGPDDDVYIDKSGISTPTVKTTKYYAPSYSGAPQVSVGAAGQVLMSNGVTSYWGNVSGGGTSSFNSAGNITADIESQRRAEIDLDCDTYKELIVCTSTQDGAYELSDAFGNTVSCKEVAVMHLNYMSEDEMLIGTMTSDTGVSKPFIGSSLSFFAESGNSITLNVKIYGR